MKATVAPRVAPIESISSKPHRQLKQITSPKLQNHYWTPCPKILLYPDQEILQLLRRASMRRREMKAAATAAKRRKQNPVLKAEAQVSEATPVSVNENSQGL
ncbi:hypothetical protein V6N11_012187 [Hibiscus sabdariffa]|uniref:Uncharacterized protein n=1 Tax=Hibiscus sabdariffa TaxID=183260 RepID=A0ABR2QAE0_9ROSI